MKRFYRYCRIFNGLGTISCLFVADEEMVEGSIGMLVSFGHLSDGDTDNHENTLLREDITILSENQNLIQRLLFAFPHGNNDGTIDGPNPLRHLIDENGDSRDAYLGWGMRGE